LQEGVIEPGDERTLAGARIGAQKISRRTERMPGLAVVTSRD
jgi:hypothetical protein